jgi:hypothetical protein
MAALLAEKVTRGSLGRGCSDLSMGWGNLPDDRPSLYPYPETRRATDCHSLTGAAAGGCCTDTYITEVQTQKVFTKLSTIVTARIFRRSLCTQRIRTEECMGVFEAEIDRSTRSEQPKKNKNEGEGILPLIHTLYGEGDRSFSSTTGEADTCGLSLPAPTGCFLIQGVRRLQNQSTETVTRRRGDSHSPMNPGVPQSCLTAGWLRCHEASVFAVVGGISLHLRLPGHPAMPNEQDLSVCGCIQAGSIRGTPRLQNPGSCRTHWRTRGRGGKSLPARTPPTRVRSAALPKTHQQINSHGVGGTRSLLPGHEPGERCRTVSADIVEQALSSRKSTCRDAGSPSVQWMPYSGSGGEYERD